MALSSPDPIMSTFELRQEMKKLAQVEKEFKVQCSEHKFIDWIDFMLLFLFSYSSRALFKHTCRCWTRWMYSPYESKKKTAAKDDSISLLVRCIRTLLSSLTAEWIPQFGGEVHELRVRADGSMSRHAGSRSRPQWRRRQGNHQGPACSA